jgi:hypothetical protein
MRIFAQTTKIYFMKRKRNKWRRFTLFSGLIILTTIAVFFSCQKEEIVPEMKNDAVNMVASEDVIRRPFYCGELVRKDLLLKNDMKIGNAFFYNDNDYFYVQLVADRGYSFHSAFLYTGFFNDIPLNANLNPDVGAFTYQIIADDMNTVRKFKIPLTDLTGSFDVSLMVQTKKSNFSWEERKFKFERSWCHGKLYGNTLFGRFFTYQKGACTVNTPEVQQE